MKEGMQSSRWQVGVLACLVLVHAVLFMFLAWLKYESFSFGDIDLALLNGGMWNLVHGQPSYSGGHVWIILFAVAPLYALFQSPLLLLFLQSLALALGGWAIYLIAREVIGPRVGLIMAVCYLIYPAANYVNLYEFHPIAFATPLLLFMFLSYQRKRWWTFLILMVLALSCREDVAIPVVGFGVFGLIEAARQSRGEKTCALKWGLVPLVAGMAWLAFCVGFLQPHFRPVETTMPAGQSPMLSFYSWLGSSPGEILKTLLLHPVKVLTGVLTWPKLKYLWDLFVPLGFVSVLSPSTFLMVLVSLSEGLLSQRVTHFSIYYQYSSIITPWVFVSTIYGIRNLTSHKALNERQVTIAKVVLGCSLLSALTLGPILRLPGQFKSWRPTREDRVRHALVNLVPPEASVVATFEFTPQLSMRPELFYFYHVYASSLRPDLGQNLPQISKKTEYVLVDFNDRLTFYDFHTPGGHRDIRDFLVKGKFQLVESANSMALFRRNDAEDLGLIVTTDPSEIPQNIDAELIPQLSLRGLSLSQTNVLDHRVIDLRVTMELSEKIPVDLLLGVRLLHSDPPHQAFGQLLWAPFRIHPTSEWRTGDLVTQRCNILVPPGAPSGSYDLTLDLLLQTGISDFQPRPVFTAINAVELE